MRSSWRDDELFAAGHPTSEGTHIDLSLKELHLLQHLRSLGGGSHTVFLVKTTGGRDGIHSFQIQENYSGVDRDG